MWDKGEMTYIIIYIEKRSTTMYVKVTRPRYMKWERYIKILITSLKSTLSLTNLSMLTLPLTTWILSHNQNYSSFLSWVTNGESLRRSYFIITRRARTIITIIYTIRRILSRLRCRRMGKSAKARLTASDVTNPGVHLTHLIKKIVQKITKISTHELKLIHNGSKRCLSSKR